MQGAVINFKEKLKNGGLMVIDMPTGTGKTHLTGELIKDNLLRWEGNFTNEYLKKKVLAQLNHIIYITPLNVNINQPFDRLRNKKEITDKKLFDDNSLRVQTNTDCVLSNFEKVFREDETKKEPETKKIMRKKESFRELMKFIKEYNRLKGQSVEYEKFVLEEIRGKYEKSFRDDLKRIMSKRAIKNHTTKAELLNRENEFAWVKELYPTCLIRTKKILFMTMDKFTNDIDPIVDEPFRIIDDDEFLKDTLVFIDEFDSTQNVLLRSEINKVTNYKFDPIKLVSNIADIVLGDKELPTSLFSGFDDSKEKKSSNSSYENLKSKLDKIKKEFNLGPSFKLSEKDQDNEKPFLFYDYTISTIHSGNNKKLILCNYDEKEGQNIISIENKDKRTSAGQDFHHLIYEVTGILEYFFWFCFSTAIKTKESYNEKATKEKKELMQFEDAILSVLEQFKISGTLAKAIAKMVMNIADKRKKSEKRKDVFSNDFYEKGFKYFVFEDSTQHCFSTDVNMYELKNTPEYYMLKLASKANVVALSATANIDSVICNYNMNYLKDKLGDKFYCLSEEEKKEIRSILDEKLACNYKININDVKLEELKNDLCSLFNDKDLKAYYSNKLEMCLDKKYKHRLEKAIKILKSIKQFMLKKESRAMLVLINKKIELNNKDAFDSIENYEKIVSEFARENDCEAPTIHYLYGSGSDYVEQKNLYFADLKKGGKVVLFSCYPSVGTGQNLQYYVPDGDENEEKDIDSLYLEYPTNNIVNVFDIEDDSESLMRYIYQIESLFENSEISYKEALDNIKAAFNIYNGNKSFTTSYVYNKPSVIKCILKTLIQGVGRICRVQNPNKNDVNIYVDDDIFKKVNFSYIENLDTNPEIKKIIEYAKANYGLDKEAVEDKTMIEIINKNYKMGNIIDNLISQNINSWKVEHKEAYSLTREFLLKNPTQSIEYLEKKSNELGISLIDCYFSFPGELTNSYLYRYDNKTGDESILKYSGITQPGFELISDESCRLATFMKNKKINNYFIEQGFATEFKRNEAILLPSVYQRLYKGILGEEVGKYLLHEMGIELKEIEDLSKFEKFDYVFENNENAYVDFKHWSDKLNITDFNNNEKVMEKVNTKRIKINAEKVFVINIIADKCIPHDYGSVVQISSLLKPNGEFLDDNDKNIIINLLGKENVNGNGNNQSSNS